MAPAIGYISGAMEFNREGATEANAIVACTDKRGAAARSRNCRERDRDPGHPSWTTGVRRLRKSLSIDDFAKLIPLKPEVVLLGTGSRQRLPPPALYAAFAERRIGLEVMDNRAACRTFNLLLSEYRDVAVALML